MAREVIHTDEAPKAIGPYSQAIRIDAGGKLVYTSGQSPSTPPGTWSAATTWWPRPSR